MISDLVERRHSVTILTAELVLVVLGLPICRCRLPIADAGASRDMLYARFWSIMLGDVLVVHLE